MVNGKAKRRYNATIDEAIFDKLREQAFRRQKPLNYLIEQALRMYLAIPKEKRVEAVTE